jgi:hypothetical protein
VEEPVAEPAAGEPAADPAAEGGDAPASLDEEEEVE